MHEKSKAEKNKVWKEMNDAKGCLLIPKWNLCIYQSCCYHLIHDTVETPLTNTSITRSSVNNGHISSSKIQCDKWWHLHTGASTFLLKKITLMPHVSIIGRFLCSDDLISHVTIRIKNETQEQKRLIPVLYQLLFWLDDVKVWL